VVKWVKTGQTYPKCCIKDVILKLSFPQSLSGNPEIRNWMPDKELWHDGKYSNNYVSKPLPMKTI